MKSLPGNFKTLLSLLYSQWYGCFYLCLSGPRVDVLHLQHKRLWLLWNSCWVPDGYFFKIWPVSLPLLITNWHKHTIKTNMLSKIHQSKKKKKKQLPNADALSAASRKKVASRSCLWTTDGCLPALGAPSAVPSNSPGFRSLAT